MTDRPEQSSAAKSSPSHVEKTPPRRARWALGAAAILAALAVGAGADAFAHRRPNVTYVALAPKPIAKLDRDGMAAVKGKVAEIFGNKFVVEDSSGRALVETGRKGEDGHLVASAEEVTVQGRFAHGFIHAAAITHADGRVETLDPPPPPPPHPPRG